MTDRHLSSAFFDSVTTAVKSIAIWDYILHLLELLDNMSDKLKRGIVLQELSNTCHTEYHRTQESFKRKIAAQTHFTSRRFKRMTDASGGAKIVMKGQPADCTVSDPQLHYILRICHPDTSPADALQWTHKLDEHNALYEGDRKRLSEAEMAALGELVIIVSFMHIMSTALPMTPVSRKSGLLFTARSAALETELDGLKSKADFGDFLVPMDNLLEPQMASSALAALDDLVTKETGAPLGSLHESLVQDSLRDLEKMCLEAKAKREKTNSKTTYVPLPSSSSPSENDNDKDRISHRSAKEKTRPTTSSTYTITSPPTPAPQPDPKPTPQKFTVKPSTSSTLTSLFSKSSARGSISWTDFASAMADLGFSVTPHGGSVYTFNPPSSMEVRPITLHRPHVADMEGYKLLILARRLERAYGWGVQSFVVA